MTNLQAFNYVKEWQDKKPNKGDYFNSRDSVSLAGLLEYYHIDLILNNYIVEALGIDTFTFESECDEETEIFQYYIVSNSDYEFLKTHFPELFVYMYCESADLCILGVTHFGTSWRGISVYKEEFKGFED